MYIYFVAFIPFIIYWTASAILYILGYGRSEFKNDRNIVTSLRVFWTTLIITFLSAIGNLILQAKSPHDPFLVRFVFILLGIFWIDTVNFFVHLAMHSNRYLYYSIHRTHHQINVPYPFAALYNSISETIITSSILTTGFAFFSISFAELVIVSSMAYVAAIIDHTRIRPFSHHFIHHAVNRHVNFQQPFFTYWDRLFGTYLEM